MRNYPTISLCMDCMYAAFFISITKATRNNFLSFPFYIIITLQSEVINCVTLQRKYFQNLEGLRDRAKIVTLI